MAQVRKRRRPSAITIRPRLGRIIRHRNIWLSLAIGLVYLLLSSFTSPFAPTQRVSIRDMAGATLTLTGFGFSVAIAAIALVVALPQSLLMRNMMLNSAGDPKTVRSAEMDGRTVAWVENQSASEAQDRLNLEQPSVFSNFVFTFLWTGIVQICAAVVAFCCQLFTGSSVVLTLTDAGGFVSGFLLTATTFYALLQLLSALQAIGLLATNQEIYLASSVHWIDPPIARPAVAERTGPQRSEDRTGSAADELTS